MATRPLGLASRGAQVKGLNFIVVFEELTIEQGEMLLHKTSFSLYDIVKSFDFGKIQLFFRCAIISSSCKILECQSVVQSFAH